MLRILFWNLNKKDLQHQVCRIAKEKLANIIILIETDFDHKDMLDALRAQVLPTFCRPRSSPSRFEIFSCDTCFDLTELYAGDRISIRRLCYAETDLILGSVHLVDRRNWDQNNQSVQTALLVSEIARQESKLGHNRTILIGDFNMNPFDPGMNMAPGMNAMMTAKCIERGERIVQKQPYQYFYNPMWGLFGDRSPGPSGTYYHTSSSQGHYGWNMLDQVLLRRSLVPRFERVEILSAAGSRPLISQQGRPDTKSASDHFPILVSLK